MKKQLISFLILFVALALTPVGLALAHGEPVIAVQPAIVVAGEEITVIGAEMEAGEVFVITLEGMADSILLGEAAVVEEGDDGGFEVTFTIPADTPPGSYTIRAATDEETAVADITITAPAEAHTDNQPAPAPEPSAAPLDLARPQSTAQNVGVIITALVSLGLGLWLVRR